MEGFLLALILLALVVISWYFLDSRTKKNASSAAAPRSSKSPRLTSFVRIDDKFSSLDQISGALRKAGLEACSLILAVDFTKSNLEQGQKTFGGKSLHFVQPGVLNPYETAISLIGKTLHSFDDDGLIPAFGFGDLTTRGTKVFPFAPQPLYGFEAVLDRYREICSTVILSGPTNFAPAIREAIKIVKETKEFHVLLILCDGQVTSERETADAIVEASNYPLSIVVIGVGDGPWDHMIEFDDNLPERVVDNLQFVDSSKFFPHYGLPASKEIEAKFAVAALQELPEHFAQCRKLGIL